MPSSSMASIRPDAAAAELIARVERDPTDLAPHDLLGVSLLMQGDPIGGLAGCSTPIAPGTTAMRRNV